MAVAFYRIAKGIELPYHLKDQLRRAASSIALNLSEGSGKRSEADRGRFFLIAMGSIRECQAIVQLEPETFNDKARDLLDHLISSPAASARPNPGPRTAIRHPHSPLFRSLNGRAAGAHLFLIQRHYTFVSDIVIPVEDLR